MKTKNYCLKVILLGDPGVGKTTLAETYCSAREDSLVLRGQYQRKVQMVYDKTINRGSETVDLTIMDTGGQERYRSITASYFRHAHCCIFVFDLSNRKSMDNISTWMTALKQYHADADSMTKLLVGTLFHSESREITNEQGSELGRNLGIPYVELLSRDREDFGGMFEKMVDMTIERLKSRLVSLQEERSSEDALILDRVYKKAWKSVVTCRC